MKSHKMIELGTDFHSTLKKFFSHKHDLRSSKFAKNNLRICNNSDE